jgi:hypothetical protein
VWDRHQGSAADGGQSPWRQWKERAMFLIGLVIIIAVLVIVVMPRIRRRL